MGGCLSGIRKISSLLRITSSCVARPCTNWSRRHRRRLGLTSRKSEIKSGPWGPLFYGGRSDGMKVVVLGAGIVGISTAWFLAREGHEVVVLDRATGAARETSFANGGQIS